MDLETIKLYPSSRREQVANAIRDAILSGQLKPGERIKEKDLSEKLGISRGPIREALRQLEKEGLIVNYPYKETVVAEFSEEEVVDVFIPIRLTLERYCVQKACQKINREAIGHLQHYVDQLIQAAARKDAPTIVENNLLFHKYIVSLAGSKSLELIWNSIMNRIRMHFYHLGAKSDVDSAMQDALEHQHILDAIAERNAEKACRLLEKHIK